MKKNIQEGVKYYLICGLEGVPGSLFHQGLDVIAAHVDPVVEIAAPKHVVVTEKGPTQRERDSPHGFRIVVVPVGYGRLA